MTGHKAHINCPISWHFQWNWKNSFHLQSSVVTTQHFGFVTTLISTSRPFRSLWKYQPACKWVKPCGYEEHAQTVMGECMRSWLDHLRSMLTISSIYKLFLVCKPAIKLLFRYTTQAPGALFCLKTKTRHRLIIWAASWQNKQNECAPSEDSDQPGYPPSLIRVFAVRMKNAGVLSYPLSVSEDSHQTGRMPRLIWVFAGRTLILLILSCRGSYFNWKKKKKKKIF